MNQGWEQVDNTYLKTKSNSHNQDEREMINLLMKWNGGTDDKTIFPGKVPWDQRDGISLKGVRAIMDLEGR